MAIELKMPALSPTMEQGTLAKWLKQEGDRIEPGDILAEIETDKATMEFEAIDEGVLEKILVAAGTEDVAVGAVIALIAGEGEEPSAAPAPAPAKAEAPAAAPEPAPAPAPKARSAGKRACGCRSCHPCRHQPCQHHRARSLARRHGRRNARRPARLRDG